MVALRDGFVGLALLASAGLCVTAPAQAAPSAPAKAQASAVEPLPDPWADKGGHSVSFAGGTGSVVQAASGNELQIRLKKVAKAVVTDPFAGVSMLGKSGIAGAFKGLKGNVKGVVVGRTQGGKPISVPVVFTSGVTGSKALKLTARPVDGNIPDELAEVFPALHGVPVETVGAKMRFVGVHATDGGAQTWRLSAATRSGALKTDGADGYSVRLPKAPNRGVGVQMGHLAAGLPWSYVDKHWSNIADKGVAPTVIVQGIGKKGVTRTLALRPETFKNAKTLRFRGEALSSLSGKAKKALRTMRGAAATLIASHSGNEKSYVVITGDSISSGESGRYIADYEAAGWFAGMGVQKYEKFCKTADLACQEATAVGNPGGTEMAAPKIKLNYEDKPTLAYEKGSEKAGECHRSYSAPGTWLARYFSTQQGEKVESINIACSGATTEAMTKPFNGQRPQADVLKEISNAVHVPLVTNTMGANDIGFSAIAIGCYMGVAGPFLSSDVDDGGDGDLMDALMAQMPTLLDAEWNPWFGKRKAKGEQEFESYNPYCSESENIGQAAEKRVKSVPGKYRKAMQELLDAAPDAQIVAHNYPNLIPHNSQSNLARKQFFGKDPMAFDGDVLGALTDPDSSVTFALNVALNNFDTPAKPDFGSWSYEKLKANQKQWADYFFNRIVMGGIVAGSNFSYPILSTLNLLYAQDMNWAAWKLIPDLNDAVYETAGDMGKRVIPVDMREVLNGREYTTAYKGAPGTPDDYLAFDDGDFYLYGRPDGLQGMQHASYTYEELSPWNPTPDQLRATFVTAPLAGLDMVIPVLCPGNEERGNFTHNGKVSNGECIGSMNEPLHPNWRGQAAQGQCLVAVVTGMAGDGNACVRSIGNNEYSAPNTGAVWGFLKSVQGPDVLCVNAKPRDDYEWKQVTPDKPYSSCSSSVSADPNWDSERWAKVAEYGNWK